MQYGPDVAVGSHEGLRQALYQDGRRVVGHEVDRQLTGYEPSAGGLRDDDPHRILHFTESGASHRLTEESLGAEVMAGRVELKCPAPQVQALPLRPQVRRIPGIDAHAREHPCQFLNIMLRVTPADSQGMKFQEFPGIVLIDVARGVLTVV